MKTTAFHGRGGGDFLASHDLEDVTVVIDGRPELVEEVASCEIGLRTYLADQIEPLLGSAAFLEARPLATPSGVSEAQIDDLERGDREPTLPELFRTAWGLEWKLPGNSPAAHQARASSSWMDGVGGAGMVGSEGKWAGCGQALRSSRRIMHSSPA